jgi:hypothetical protein
MTEIKNISPQNPCGAKRFKFESAMVSASARMTAAVSDKNYGMRPERLLPIYNLRIIEALKSLGLRAPDEEAMVYFSKPSEEYLGMLQTGTDRDRDWAKKVGEWRETGGFRSYDSTSRVYRSHVDAQPRAFVDDVHIQKLSWWSGVPEEVLKLAVPAHELGHLGTFGNGLDILEKGGPLAELVAEYVAIQSVDNYAYHSFMQRHANDRDYLREYAQAAVDKVISDLDPAFAAKIRKRDKEYDLIGRAETYKLDIAGFTVNEDFFNYGDIWMAVLTDFFDFHVAGLKGRPKMVSELMEKIVRQYKQNIETSVKTKMAALLKK